MISGRDLRYLRAPVLSSVAQSRQTLGAQAATVSPEITAPVMLPIRIPSQSSITTPTVRSCSITWTWTVNRLSGYVNTRYRVVVKMDPRDLDRHSHIPLYRQLADVMRAAITSGDLAPGDPLPAEGEMCAVYRLSKSAVRDALGLLRAEGRIEKSRGQVSRVAELQPVQWLSTTRYADELERHRNGQPDEPSSDFTTRHGIGWDSYTVDARYSEEQASEIVAEHLGIPTGTPVLRRWITEYADGIPRQVRTSYYPLAIVAGTDVADPTRQPWPGGTVAEIEALGYVPGRVDEEARARPAQHEELRELDLADGAHVVEIRRIFEAAGEAIELSTVVMPAASVVLHYRTDL